MDWFLFIFYKIISFNFSYLKTLKIIKKIYKKVKKFKLKIKLKPFKKLSEKILTKWVRQWLLRGRERKPFLVIGHVRRLSRLMANRAVRNNNSVDAPGINEQINANGPRVNGLGILCPFVAPSPSIAQHVRVWKGTSFYSKPLIIWSCFLWVADEGEKSFRSKVRNSFFLF